MEHWKQWLVLSMALPFWGSDMLAADFAAPQAWHTVQTNAVQAWQEAQQARASETVRVWYGVSADLKKREIHFLAEAVGHPKGITAEFMLIGPQSDRAYEAVGVTVAKPSDLVRAVESLGLSRGGCVGRSPFCFWPMGERLSVTMRRLDGATPEVESPLQQLICDAEIDEPLLGARGVVFTGGTWTQEVCETDTRAPCSVLSLYNAGDTLFDVPSQISQSEGYGRVTIAETLPYGALLEIVMRPLAAEGQAQVLPLTLAVWASNQVISVTCQNKAGKRLKEGDLATIVTWMKQLTEEGRELFVTVGMSDDLLVKQAVEVARIFDMLNGHGLKLEGKTPEGLFNQAFLPLEKWREREGRMPQPFELHVTRQADGTYAKKMIFIEEDWQVEGLDPKLTPREFEVADWNVLPEWVQKVGGPDNKVQVLFVFAPQDAPLHVFMPGVRVLAQRLPTVYVFAE